MLNQQLKSIPLIMLLATLILSQMSFATEPKILSTEIANEKSIVFETMDGIKTDAFSGFIQVPENRKDPKSRSLKVHYVRFPATSDKKGSPIVYLSGGPGGSGINTAKYPKFRFPLFMALREFGDVIALDQRGTGLSKDIPKCKSNKFLPMTELQTDDKLANRYKLAAIECLEFWKGQGIDILGYNTIESAKDLDDLRLHLQSKKLTLWGISYGSHLAFAAMKVFPDNIDKVIIASAEGLNQTVKLPVETDRYFDRLQAAINMQPKAAQQYPDIKSLIKRVNQNIAEKPLNVTLTNKDGTQKAFLFQKHHLQGIASSMIADPNRRISYLLELYTSLDKGSLEGLNAILASGIFNDNQINFEAMPFAMDIASGITDDRLKLVNQQATDSLLGLALNFPMPLLNKVVPNFDLDDEFRRNPQNAIPTLLLTGTLDGRTYIDSQYAATKGLTRLTKVTVENAGHNLFMSSAEVTRVIEQFLNNESISNKTIKVDLPDFVQ